MEERSQDFFGKFFIVFFGVGVVKGRDEWKEGHVCGFERDDRAERGEME